MRLRKSAVVRFHPDKSHNSLISLSVIRVKKGSVKDLAAFTLNPAVRRSNVYYVHVSVKNTGTGNLSGRRLIMYGQVRATLVVPPIRLGSTFKRCSYQPLPKHFVKGHRANVCMVMLAPHHGTITHVQWRFADKVEPISWALP